MIQPDDKVKFPILGFRRRKTYPKYNLTCVKVDKLIEKTVFKINYKTKDEINASGDITQS